MFYALTNLRVIVQDCIQLKGGAGAKPRFAGARRFARHIWRVS